MRVSSVHSCFSSCTFQSISGFYSGFPDVRFRVSQGFQLYFLISLSPTFTTNFQLCILSSQLPPAFQLYSPVSPLRSLRLSSCIFQSIPAFPPAFQLCFPVKSLAFPFAFQLNFPIARPTFTAAFQLYFPVHLQRLLRDDRRPERFPQNSFADSFPRRFSAGSLVPLRVDNFLV